MMPWDWIFAYLKSCNLRVVHPAEVFLLQKFVRGEPLQDHDLATIVLVLETLLMLNLKIDELDKLVHQMDLRCSAQRLAREWPKIIKAMLQTLLTSDQRFEEAEVRFILQCLVCDFQRPFLSSDKSKSYGPFTNRTFWAEIAFRFNVNYPHRRRGVVAIRNKIKNILAEPTSPAGQPHGYLLHQLKCGEQFSASFGTTARVGFEPLHLSQEVCFDDSFSQEVFAILLAEVKQPEIF